MKKIVVSACLLGENCKYNGGNNENAAVKAYLEGKNCIPVCPERQAGLGIPRIPIEIVNGVLMGRDGSNADTVVRKAVEEVLQWLKTGEIECAVLQSRSPTCGVNQVYDGSFSGKLIPGSGVFAQALKDAGYTVVDAQDIPCGD